MVVQAAIRSADPVSSEGCLWISHSLHAVVDAVAHIDVKPPWLTKERLVAWGAAAVAVAGGVALGVRLRFNHHTPKQAAVLLVFHQQATDEVGGDQLGGAGEKALGGGAGKSLVMVRVAMGVAVGLSSVLTTVQLL
jgi:hypothetical protein